MAALLRSILFLSFLSAAGSAAAKNSKPDVVIRFDPDKPNRKSAVVWLGYLVARTAFHEEHKLPMPPSGEIRPSFAEEVHARKTAVQVYRELKAKDGQMRDAYWDVLSEVDQKGFMGAYVWIFLRRSEWPNSDRPHNLGLFEKWQKRALPNHQPQTYGWIEGGKS
jgi:hypothetical protein